VDETLTVDQPNFKLGTLFVIKNLNGWAGDKSVPLQHGIPNGRKFVTRYPKASATSLPP
jgi:hypothetical protein